MSICPINAKVSQIVAEYRRLAGRCCSPQESILAILPANLTSLCGDGRGVLKEIYDAVNRALALGTSLAGCQRMVFYPNGIGGGGSACSGPPSDPASIACLTEPWLDQFICWLQNIVCGDPIECLNDWDWRFWKGHAESGWSADGWPYWATLSAQSIKIIFADAANSECGGSDSGVQEGEARCCFTPAADGLLSIACDGWVETRNPNFDEVRVFVDGNEVIHLASIKNEDVGCGMESRSGSTAVPITAGNPVHIRVTSSTVDQNYHKGACWTITFGVS